MQPFLKIIQIRSFEKKEPGKQKKKHFHQFMANYSTKALFVIATSRFISSKHIFLEQLLDQMDCNYLKARTATIFQFEYQDQ